MEIMRLRSEVNTLKARIRECENDMKSFAYITEKVLLEESPNMGALRDCFPALRLTPPDLVAQHAALVKSCDDFDNASYSYPQNGQVFIFKCHKEKHLFGKDHCTIQVWVLRPKVAPAAAYPPQGYPPQGYPPQGYPPPGPYPGCPPPFTPFAQ